MFIDLLESRQSASKTIARSLRRSATIIQGDARNTLSILPNKCVQCVVTSPPYWGVRDYNVDGQIGLETKLESYLLNLLEVFQEIWRVLSDDGVMWVNMGDVYASGNRKYRAPDTKYPQRALANRPNTPEGLKRKDIIGIPWRLAFALQKNGWYLRTDVIWSKSNSMPESVRDRPSRCHEYMFMFSKSEHYKFSRYGLQKGHVVAVRSVWNIATTRSELKSHHAAFPESLVFPCIQAASRKGDLVLDPFCGTGTVGSVCSKLGRRFVGIDLNQRFAQAAVKRLGTETCWLRTMNSQQHPTNSS